MRLYLEMGIFRNLSLLGTSFVIYLFFLPTFAISQENPLSNCSLYRSKRKEVPVFAEPAATSEILDNLSRGEQICYIGEQNGFAIAQWDKQSLLRGQAPETVSRLGYVRLVELWPPRESAKTLPQQAQEAYNYQRQGGFSDDPLWFIRSWINWAFPFDPCKDPQRVGCAPPK